MTAIITRPTNAAIDDDKVYLSYPGGATVKMTRVGTADKFEGTTATPITGDTTFTVQVTDVRGQTAQNTISVANVVAYTLPSVTKNILKRCDSEGNEDSGGEYYQIRVTANINTKLPNNQVTKLTVGIKGDTANRYNLTSGQTSEPHGGLTQPNRAYTLTVVIQDKISGEIESEYKIEGKQRDFVLNHVGGKTHLGIGTTPLGGDVNTVEVPMNGLFLVGGIPAQAFTIPYTNDTDGSTFNKDFLHVDFTTRTAAANATVFFKINAAGIGETTNYPVMASGDYPDFYGHYGWAGLRTVTLLDEDFAMVQITEFAPIPGRIWFNTHVKTAEGQETWSGWKYHPPTVI